MADALLTRFRTNLPAKDASLVEPYLSKLEAGQYEDLLISTEARALFGHDNAYKTTGRKYDHSPSWADFIFLNLGDLLADRSQTELQYIFFCIGYSALLAFLQSNATGPPLPFSSAKLLLPELISSGAKPVRHLRQKLISDLGQDGIAAYKLTPNIELLCLADAIFTSPPILKNISSARWAKCRVAFLHQRLLSEVSSTLQNLIYDDLDLLADDILKVPDDPALIRAECTEFLLERATIHIHHGLDKFAREDLDQAKKLQHFDYVLTGRLGKRTKFQEKETSQLVVLAKSHTGESLPAIAHDKADVSQASHQPANLDLNDDTLLESISFSQQETSKQELPSALESLDPSDQPKLDPLDSTILLSFASSITNTRPEDGLTREETLPYATRVLDGGSSNWQIYTQALLIRSRIEGYRSRTVERGLLQLQALVDQVIADTYSSDVDPAATSTEATAAASFLPRAKESEGAPVSQRLRYIFQLASPTRWNLEAELATRWVQLGGLRSALEIYERLEMWADAALCWAATDREDKAKTIIRRQLYESNNPPTTGSDEETWEGPERDPPPLDAPRLYCILGDIDKSPEMYEKAWSISNGKYARAQRSLGRLYLSSNNHLNAADAYSKSLKANPLNHTSWFALGCCLLELSQFPKAAEAFSRCIQLDDTDAESWSNLAAALLHCDPEPNPDPNQTNILDDDDNHNPQKNRIDALKALQRAAKLKRDSHRIWQNVLIVAASLHPPDYPAVLAAQHRLIDLRSATEGEKAIDQEILTGLVHHVITSHDSYDPTRPGFARVFVRFVDDKVVPLITASARLWRLVSRLAVWRGRPLVALEAEEKAWRAVVGQPGWETESEARWEEVVEATVRLCDAYESLGPRERTEGLGAGEVVARDWKFKAKTAVRGIMGRGKASWDGTAGWERLDDLTQQLRK